MGDAGVLKCISMLTFLPLEEIDAMEGWEGSQLNRAKEILAFELTKLIHGEQEAAKAEETSKGLFAGAGSLENMPATVLSDEAFEDESINAAKLLVSCGLCASNGEARRLIQQGGVMINEEKVGAIDTAYDKALFDGDGVIIKKSKKVLHRASLN